VLEGLVCSGAFDSLKSPDTNTNHWRARPIRGNRFGFGPSCPVARTKAMGQDDLFGGFQQTASEIESVPDAPSWTAMEMLTAEKKRLGFTSPAIRSTITWKLLAFGRRDFSRTRAAGYRLARDHGRVVRSLQLKTTKKGDRFAIFSH
jgi:DNA polymerase III alpha subunit